MILKKEISLACVLFLIVSAAFSQRSIGILGKSNEISTNPMGWVLNKDFAFNYKRILSKNVGVIVGYNIHKPENKTFAATLIDFNYNSTDASISKSKSKLGIDKTISLGLIFSSPFTHLPLPLGYYFGLIVKSSTFDFQFYSNPFYIYEFNSTTYIPEQRFNVKNKTYQGVVRYGKSNYIFKNIVLDLFFDVGMYYSKYALIFDKNLVDISSMENTSYSLPENLFKQGQYFTKTINFDNYGSNSNVGLVNYKAVTVGFILAPQLRVGYVF
jgi:hypothetical protein